MWIKHWFPSESPGILQSLVPCRENALGLWNFVLLVPLVPLSCENFSVFDIFAVWGQTYINSLWAIYTIQSGDFPSQSPPFRGAKYRTSPVRQVRHTASCGFMVDPCGAPWWPLRCNGLDALSAPYVYVVISPNMPSHIPTEWDPLHTKHSISLQSLGPSE